MEKIFFCNVNYLGNAGDYWASPLHYYNFSDFEYNHISFVGENAHEIENSIFIIGGGGLIITKDNYLNDILESILQKNKVIFWGVGSNTACPPNFEILSHPNVILSSTRDIHHNLRHEYVPCVSCKHNLFDKTSTNPNGVGILEHPNYSINIDEFPKIQNNDSIDKIVSFISSKEFLISSTYHGVYWSQLLDKKVVYFNDDGDINSKFFYLKHRVDMCNSSNYKLKLQLCNQTFGLLKESRTINDEFYKKVFKTLENLR